jgi:release factor glutamine methyltransferase
MVSAPVTSIPEVPEVPEPGLPPLWALPGVYRPQHDTRLLGQALRRETLRPGSAVLDIGTGSGALALLAARMGAEVCATDVSWRAVLTARMNAARHGQRVRVRRGSLAAAHRRAFDLVVSNPPYVPVPVPVAGWAPGRRRARAWEAGRDGREVLDRLVAAAPGLLRPGGVMLLVHSGMCGAGTTVARLADAGLAAEVTHRALVPFGPVLKRHARWLRERGLLGADDTHEELVVIRAERR